MSIAQAIRMRLLVFEMQQLQRDVLAALVLAVDLQPIRLRTARPRLVGTAPEQPLFENDLVQVVWQRPAHPSGLGPFPIALDRRGADPDAPADLAAAEALRGQAQHLGDLTHG